MARCQKVSRYYIIFFYKTFITVIYICRLSYTWVFFNTVSSKIPQKDFYKGNTYIYIYFFSKKCFRPKKKVFWPNFFFYSSRKVESTRVDYFWVKLKSKKSSQLDFRRVIRLDFRRVIRLDFRRVKVEWIYPSQPD